MRAFATAACKPSWRACMLVGMLLALLAVLSPNALAATATQLSGTDRYDTAAQAARLAYPDGANAVIVASGEAWADAVSAAGLAGLLDAPLVFTSHDELPSVTADTVNKLGPQLVVLVGGQERISRSVESELRAMPGVSQIERLAGADRYATQMAIYEYGQQGYDGTNHWSSSLAIVTSGANYPDALSASPLAMVARAPIFLADHEGNLSSVQKSTLRATPLQTVVAVGGPAVISDQTIDSLGGAGSASDADRSCVQLHGDDRYATCAAVAEWSVENGYLSWENPAFATGANYADALAGGVMQGKRGAPLLLVQDVASPAIAVAAANAQQVSSYAYLGGTAAIDQPLRRYIAASLDNAATQPVGSTVTWDDQAWYVAASGLYLQSDVDATGKVGWQNPSDYYQVSSFSATLPEQAYQTDFHYVTPSSIAVDASRTDCIETMIARAYDYLGTPYRWGYSREPGVGVDCSGLVIQCLYACGMDTPYNSYVQYYDEGLPRTTSAMLADPKFCKVPLEQRQRGDLIFYSGHVAIYLGDDQIIEATPPQTVVSSMWRNTPIGVVRPFV